MGTITVCLQLEVLTPYPGWVSQLKENSTLATCVKFPGMETRPVYTIYELNDFENSKDIFKPQLIHL